MPSDKKSEPEMSEREIAERRDALAKRILRTPPDPQKRLGESGKKATAKREKKETSRD